MAVFEVEDVVIGHPRFAAAGPAASWLWVVCGAWSRRESTEGFIPVTTVRAFGRVQDARRLVKVELWAEEDGGFRYLRWRESMGSPESAEVEERRRREREKKARWRARNKVDKVDIAVDMSTDVHGTVHGTSTGQSTNVHRGVDTPLSQVVPPLSPPQGDDRRKRRRSLPSGWTPSERHREYAGQHRLDVESEAAKFRDYHAMKGTLALDWDAGFRNWLARAVEYRDERAAARPAPKSNADAWMNL